MFTPVSTWWGHALTTAGWNDFLVLAGTMVVNFVTEFLYQRFVVYRNRIDTNDVARRASRKGGGLSRDAAKAGMDWKRALSTALFVALVALLAWYVYENRADMARLLALSAGDVALMLALALGGCVMNCVYHRLILSTYRIPLDAVDWMGVTFVANAMAYVLPMRADLVFSAAYYKRTKGLAYVKA